MIKMRLEELLDVTYADMPILAVEDGKVVYDSRARLKLVQDLVRSNKSRDEQVRELLDYLKYISKYIVYTIETKMYPQLDDDSKKEKCIIVNVYQL